MKRRWRQPSRQLRRCGGRERPSRRSVTGTSASARPAKLARTTISEANSMPGHCSPSPRTASRRKARRPQWKSWTGAVKNRRPRAVRIGLPIQRCFHGMAPGRIRPPPAGRRQPMTRSAPAAQCAPGTAAARRSRRSRRRRPSGRTGRAPRRCRRPARCRSHGRRRRPPAPRRPAPRACEPSVLPLSATITSPTTPAAASAAAASPTQAARVSASFRQGIRIVSSTAGSPRVATPPAHGLLEEHRPRSPAGSRQRPNRRRAPAKSSIRARLPPAAARAIDGPPVQPRVGA